MAFKGAFKEWDGHNSIRTGLMVHDTKKIVKNLDSLGKEVLFDEVIDIINNHEDLQLSSKVYWLLHDYVKLGKGQTIINL